MGKKLQTQLHNFRFNKAVQKGSLIVEWFRYDPDEYMEENISGFNEEDLKLFENILSTIL